MNYSSPENLQVVFEDNHLIVVNKRPGDIVQGDKTGDIPLSDVVKAYIKEKFNKPGAVFLGTVHRIDRPVSGLVVYARTSKALARLNNAFKEREVLKTYLACTRIAPPETDAALIHYMTKNEKQNKSVAVDTERKGYKRSELHYTQMGKSTQYVLLMIIPQTGRHHQIRAQLAAIGCPIKGDVKYGFQRGNQDGSIHLHAWRLELSHPVTKELLQLQAEPPQDPVWDAFSTIWKAAQS